MNETVDLGVVGLSPAVYVGAGGSANVFAARRLDSGEQVAVKLLRASADSAKERERFEREHETLSRLATHDGIVPVLDAGVTDRNEPYFLMPLMEGSLQDRIDIEGAMEWEAASQLIAEISDTLDFAHAHSVLHRDLKPGNILLDAEGVPRIADFGIAKLLDSNVSKSSKALGTPSFMPPERFKTVEATKASDVYGLGATLAALLTGTAPFLTGENDTDAIVMMRVMNEAPAPLENGVPAPIAAVVTQSMAKDPLDRPASAGEFANLLRTASAESGGAVSSGPVTVAIPRRELTVPAIGLSTQSADPESKRRPGWILIAAAAMFLALVGVGSALALSLRDGTGADQVDLETSQVLGASETNDETDSNDADSGDAESDGANSDGANSESATQETAKVGDSAGDDEPSEGAAGSPATETSDSGGDAPGANDDSVASTTDAATGQSASATPRNDSTDPEERSGTIEPTATAAPTTSAAPVERPPAVVDPDEDDAATTTTVAEVAPVVKPSASFTASASSVEEGERVTFTNTSTGEVASRRWEFGDGGSSTSSSTSRTYSSAGTYTVKLTVTGPGGEDTATRTIRVEEKEATEPEFTQRIEISDLGENNVRFRFQTNVTTGYTVFIRRGSSRIATEVGTATGGTLVNANIGGLEEATEYTVQVRLDGPPSVDSGVVLFKTAGTTTATTIPTPVTLDNLRLVTNGSTSFTFNYESNICANGSFVIREAGTIVGSNSGQRDGCTSRHLGVPGFWTPALKPNTTYVVTVTVEANGQGQGGGNTATKTLTVTTAA